MIRGRFFFLLVNFIFCLKLQAQISFVLTNTVCANDSLYLSANLNTYPATTFSWVSQPIGVIFSAPSNSNTSISFTNSGLYTITLMASVGNSTAFATNSVQVHPNPQITIIASSATICSGQNATLIASGADTYTWVPSIGFVVAFGGTAQVSPGTTSIYSVSGSNGYGCEAKSTYTIEFSSFPYLTTLSTASAVCNGYTSTLTAFGANSYTWISPQFANAQYQATVSVSPGTFTLLGSNGGTCRDSILVTIELSPPLTVSVLADRTVICKDGGDTLVPITLTAEGAITYVWEPYQPGFMTYSIGQITAVSPSATTCYTLTGSTINCKGSNTVCILVQTCQGLGQEKNSKTLVIYPNPVKDFVTLKFENEELDAMELWDQYGKCLIRRTPEITDLGLMVLNLSEIPKGFYYIQLFHHHERIHAVKILKE